MKIFLLVQLKNNTIYLYIVAYQTEPKLEFFEPFFDK